MTRISTHVLTGTEIACGVSLEQVAEQLPRVLLVDEGTGVVIPAGLAPALAGSVARCALGVPADLSGFNRLGLPVYRPRPDTP